MRPPLHVYTATNRRQFLGVAAGSLLLGRVSRAQDAEGAPAVEPEAPRLDAHVHVSSPDLEAEITKLMGANPFEGGDAAALVERLDASGVKAAWVLSTAYMLASDAFQLSANPNAEAEVAGVRAENDYTAREAARFPERLTGFLSVNPKRAYATEEIDRCVDELGLKGVKLHMWNSLADVRDEEQRGAVRKVLEHAASRDVPVVVHAFNGSVPGYGARDAEIWAKELVLPTDGLRICFAHVGGPGGFMPPVQAVLESLVAELGPDSDAAERAFLDVSAVLMGENTIGFPPLTADQGRKLGELLRAWDPERVLWGSDNLPGYFEHSRAAWPLEDEDWSLVARQTGEGLLGGKD